MEGGQMKAGLRNALICLLFIVLLVPMLKAGVQHPKVKPYVPEFLLNWILAV
jgi:hypothetical protein